MTTYKARGNTYRDPVQIDLEWDKFHRWFRDKPVWFKKEYETGNIMVTKNAKEKYVTVRNKNGIFKLYENDWLIRNEDGLMFGMVHNLFKESFEEVPQ